MKKKLLMLTLTGVMALSVVGATACGGKEPDHVCSWESTWTTSDTHHWHWCTIEGCNLVGDKATHSYTDGVCVCGREDPNYVPPHECEFEETLSKDATHHWYACKDDTCQLVKDKEEHEYVEDVCICGALSPDYVEDVEVIGFNTKESVSVLSNTKIVLEKPEPVDQYGEKLTVYTEVTTSDGKHVTIHDDGAFDYFNAVSGEYKINYVVYPKDGVITLKTTTVTTLGEDSLSINLDKIVETNKEVLIVSESGFYNPTFTYIVKKDGVEIPVSDGVFTPDATGYYDISVKATSGEFSIEESVRIYARNAKQEGEVETFYSDWEELRKVNGVDLHGWSIIDSKTANLKNRFGVDDTFATIKVKSTDTSVSFWVDPLFDADYYRELAKNGYKSLVFYVYTDTDYSVPMTFITDTVNDSHLNVDKGGTFVNAWTKVEINLIEDAGVDQCLDRSFLSGFKVYDNSLNGFLSFKNASQDEFNIYIANIFAVKDTEISKKQDANTDLMAGDEVELSILFNSEVDCDYYVTNTMAKTTEKVDATYKFRASGEYVVKAVPARQDLLGEAEVSVSVQDTVTMEKSWTKVKMTGESLIVKFDELGISLKNGNETVDWKVTSVSFHDDYTLDLTDTGFTATTAGYYKLFIEGTFGDGLKTYKQFDLDIYTEEDALKLLNSEDLIATRYWAYQKLPTVEYGEFTVREVTDTMFRYRASTGAMVVFFRPMYSKAYYQDIIDNNDTCQVLFRFYTENVTGKSLFAKFIDTYGQKEMKDYDHEKLIDLSYFVNNYDKFASGYQRELQVVKSGGNPVYDFVTTRYDYLLATNNNSGNHIYFRDMPILISYTDDTENLIDVSNISGDTFDATTTLNADAKAVVNGYDASEVSWKYTDVFGNTIDGKEIDITKPENKRLWKFNGLFGGNVIYTGYVDLYNPEDGFVWNTDKKWTFYAGEALINRGNGTASTVAKDGVAVDTTMFTATDDYKGGTNYLTFANRPMHSKTYYEQYRGKVTFSFSFYCEILDKDGNPDSTSEFSANLLAIHTSGSYKTQVSTGKNLNNTWFNRSFKLDAMLDKWTYAEFEGQIIKNWADRENYGIFFVYDPRNESASSKHAIHITELTYSVKG